MHFEIQAECPATGARAGLLHTNHGIVETPVFMPVGTQATVKGVLQRDLAGDLDAKIILANTYHLFLRPGPAMIRQLGGLHRFMAWDRAILTDSGGFQVFSLSDLRKVTDEGVLFRSHLNGDAHLFTPQSTIDAQLAFGSDIIMALDECLAYPASHEAARDAMRRTVRWARAGMEHWKESGAGRQQSGDGRQESGAGRQESGDGRQESGAGRQEAGDRRQESGDGRQEPGAGRQEAGAGRQESGAGRQEPGAGRQESGAGRQEAGEQPGALFPIVQGSMFADLRAECARELIELDAPGYAIGGLSVGEPRTLSLEMTAVTAPLLPRDRPRYVMGVGMPEELPEYVARGVDMMDCVLPSRNARNGCLFTSAGRIIIKQARYRDDPQPLDPQCACYTCRTYSRAYLRHLFQAGEMVFSTLATLHNLKRYLDIMRQMRQAILLGRFPAYLDEVRREALK